MHLLFAQRVKIVLLHAIWNVHVLMFFMSFFEIWGMYMIKNLSALVLVYRTLSLSLSPNQLTVLTKYMLLLSFYWQTTVWRVCLLVCMWITYRVLFSLLLNEFHMGTVYSWCSLIKWLTVVISSGGSQWVLMLQTVHDWVI